MPGVLAEGDIAPVVASMLKPAVELNVPPDVPVRLTLVLPFEEHIKG